MSLKSLTVLLIGLFAAFNAASTYADTEVAGLPPADPAIIEDIFSRLTALRTQRGLEPYQLNPLLNAAAQDQAMWLVATGLRGHYRPDGSTPKARVENAGYPYQGWCCGENYYMSIDATPDLVWNFWVHSRSHYNNLTNWNFKDVGIGTTTDGYRISYVMVFANPFDPTVVEASPAAEVAAPPAEVTTVADGEYRVQAGDSLYRLAQQFGVSVEALASANGISDPRMLREGQALVIPDAGTEVAQEVAPAEETQVQAPVAAAEGTHIIQSGENLYRLAQQYGVSVEALASANGISDPRMLREGQVLVIPDGSTEVVQEIAPVEQAPVQQPVVAAEGTHIVQDGENLYRLAEEYGLSVEELAAINGISDPRTLHVGQVLVVVANGGG